MIEVRLLGQCTVMSAGVALPIPSRPARLLLAYLMLHRHVYHSREHLAAARRVVLETPGTVPREQVLQLVEEATRPAEDPRRTPRP